VIELNRCVCGYLHVGPAPDRCPVCGASASGFSRVDSLPELAGTKTLDNLKAAFAGESQANRKYTLWRRIAELEGAPDSTLDAFDRAAAEETAHALGHLAYIGGFGTTAENLKAASEGEDFECTEMYPEFSATAEAEGLDAIAGYFRSVGRFEKEHREGYLAALAELEGA
jgi:ferredoxin hydrogenase